MTKLHSIGKPLFIVLIAVAVLATSAVLLGVLGQPSHAAQAEVLDITRPAYPTVKVEDDESFRAALTSEGKAYIVVDKDISFESGISKVYYKDKPGYTYEFFDKIESIHVKGDKILNLNGHQVYYSDKSQLYYRITTGGFGNELRDFLYHGEYSHDGPNAFSYENTLIQVDEGATLRIVDTQGDKGTLQFDSMFSEIDDAPYNVIRNVIQVNHGGKLFVYGGNLVAGRSKKIYSYVKVEYDSHYSYHTVTAYNMGSAVIVDGGEATISGGVLKGRGATYDGREVACVLVKDGSLLVEGGKLFSYGYAYTLRVHEKAISNVRLTGGYLEAYKEEYAAYMSSLGLRSNVFKVDLGSLAKDDNWYYPLDFTQLIDQDATSFYIQTDGDKEGTASESNKQYTTFSPKERTLETGLLAEDGSADSLSVYQYQALDLTINYGDYANWAKGGQFWTTALMQSEMGPFTNAEEIKQYWASHGITANFTVSKLINDKYRAIETDQVLLGHNEGFPYTYTLKAGDKKWDKGEYKIALQITERDGDKSITYSCNVLTVNVVDAKDMLVFEDDNPKTWTSNLGNQDLGSEVALKYNAKTKVELDRHLSLQKIVYVRKPNSSKYVEVNYNSVLGTFYIQVDQPGYYSVMEVIQLKNGSNVLAQASREGHFAGVDATRQAVAQESSSGKVLFADAFGRVGDRFKPGDRVYLQITPNQSNVKVSGVQVQKTGDASITVPVSGDYESFVMPDYDVTIVVQFGRVYTLQYKASANAPTDETVKYDADGLTLKGATYSKEGYRQVGWTIAGQEYGLNAAYSEKQNATALPKFEPITYSKVIYRIGDGQYEHSINYNYLNDPYYTALGDEELSDNLKLGEHIDYYTLTEDLVGEIDGQSYSADTYRIYPGEQFVPMKDELVLVAHVQEMIVINPVFFEVEGDNKLNIGLNNFGLTVENAKLYLDEEKTNELTQLNLPAKEDTTITVYVYPNDGYRFATEFAFGCPTLAQSVADGVTIKCDLYRLSYELDGSNAVFKLVFHTSCGPNDSDHNWEEEYSVIPHWCTIDQGVMGIAGYVCQDCGEIKYQAVDRPDNLPIDQEHHLVFVNEVEGDCAKGEYTIGSHYECEDCGKWFSRLYGGQYQEHDPDYYAALHSYYTAYGIKEIYGREMDVHYEVCADCGHIDPESYGFHEDSDGDLRCDVCLCDIPCQHEWEYEEVLSTCSLRGSLHRHCDKCGEDYYTYYELADHTLVYVEETPSTCIEHGAVAHFRCSDCGKTFDEDVYIRLAEIDPEGYRSINLDDEDLVYYLTPDMESTLETEYDSDSAFKRYDELNDMYVWDWAYIAEHSNACKNDEDLALVVRVRAVVEQVNAYMNAHEKSGSFFVAPLDPDRHVNTEVRDAVAVSVKADGYSGDLWCADCNTKLSEGHVIAKHEHAYTGEEWSSDDDKHFHVCNAYDGCDERLDQAAHTWGEWHYLVFADQMGQKWRECTVCGHVHIEDYAAEPETIDGRNVYRVTEGLDALSTEDGLSVHYIFDLAKQNEAGVLFETDLVSVLFDKDAVKEITDANVRFKLSTTDDLQAFGMQDAKLAVNLSLGGVTFAGGKATVSIVLGEVNKNSEVKVYFVDGNDKTDMNAQIKEGKAVFDTTHFSTYVMAYEGKAPVIEPDPIEPEPIDPGPQDPDPADPGQQDPQPEKPEAPQKNGLSGGAIAGIVIGVVAAVAAIGVGCFFALKKKGKGPKGGGDNGQPQEQSEQQPAEQEEETKEEEPNKEESFVEAEPEQEEASQEEESEPKEEANESSDGEKE